MLYGAASVDAKSLTVAEVISQRYPFAVPRYQRSYAWDDQAVNYFVRDIEVMLEHDAGLTSHFFGGVVCIQLTDNQKTRPTSYEVVDGQQRMATLMLALSCVVEMAETLIKRCERSEPPRRVRRLSSLRLQRLLGSGGERSELARPRLA